MRGKWGDLHDLHAAYTHHQVSQCKGSHEMTFLTKLHSNPGPLGSRLFPSVLLYFLRVSIPSFMGRMNGLKEVTLYREFKCH